MMPGGMPCLRCTGHGHLDVVKATHGHAGELDHLFSGFASPPDISRLCASIATSLWQSLPEHFLNINGESNEIAIKTAKIFTSNLESLS
ncbi:2,2-dialkylglycine decarboxylase 1 [Colletotrichum musicola]|uniref:2,2-dialkylglycine decarboxylase 1 n=1 Tax=Colletotrichum musicola TaxID=2175873 RepID=A0A8H6KLJ8_9PEZI|nr:2,2-dialkylglycine decarboxylase 1 [Colletotrichum musicola]